MPAKLSFSGTWATPIRFSFGSRLTNQHPFACCSRNRLRSLHACDLYSDFAQEPALIRSRLVVLSALALSLPFQIAVQAQSRSSSTTTPAKVAAISGTVADSTGAIIPGAQVQLMDGAGTVAGAVVTDASGNFRIHPPQQGDYTLSVSMNGFGTSSQHLHAGAIAGSPVSFTLEIASSVTQVTVNAGSDIDLTSSENNGDTSVMTAGDLKTLPVFDNDYVTAMSNFMDAGDTATAGTGLMVDGVEANRATVSPSAVQEIHINEDPYSAQYYRPGRGQLEIITKPNADKYHGEFNFMFRDSALNAQNAFAPSKPFEQRRIYEGNLTGPILHSQKTGFLFSFNRSEEDLDAVVNATVLDPANPANPQGAAYRANVAAPTRNTEFSLRVGHQFTDKNNAYATYSFQDSTNRNQNVGNQTLPEVGVNTEYREDDLILHDDYILSASKLNQASLVLERVDNPYTDVKEAPQIKVQGDFTGGSAQNNQDRSEYNLRMSDIVSWTRGPHSLKFGINVPHFSRRVLDDRTNSAGTYTFASLADYQNNNPSGYSAAQGATRFIYHQQEVGGFIQDQIKVNARLSLTPALRYDWQNFLARDRNNFSPRLSFAYVLDPSSKTVMRGGGGIYYDRIGGGPLVDMARYESARRRLVRISSNQQPLCYPVTDCVAVDALPASLLQLQPGIRTPYQMHFGLSVERQIGEKATISIGGRVNRGADLFRSVDLNAPLPSSNYRQRPNPSIGQLREIQSEGYQKGAALDINYRGRFNRYFTAFAWYSWTHYGNNTDGIYWFPEDQQNPEAEWGRPSFDLGQRFGIFGEINADHPLNLGFGVFANGGHPYSITTGQDNFGDNLFNARPEDVTRDSEVGPDYVDMDLRWGYDFKLHPREMDKSPTLGLSASAFNVLNHVNGSYIDSVEGSPDFNQVISAAPPRRVQLAMRFVF